MDLYEKSWEGFEELKEEIEEEVDELMEELGLE